MTKQKTGKKRKLIIIVVIVSLVVAGVLVYRHYKYKFANEKIQGLVGGKNKGLYNIQYDNLLLDEVNGTLRVDNVRLTPDTAFYFQMQKEHKEPPVLITITVPALNITGIKTPKALLNKEIEGGKVEIKHPIIEIGIDDLLKDTTEYSPSKELYKQILGELKSIKIDSIVVTGADLIVKDIKSGKTKFKGKDVSFILSDLLIDSIQKDDKSRILFSKNVDVICKEIVLPSKDKMYTYHFENLEFISQVNSFNAGAIRVVPALGEEAFTQTLKFQKDRYDFVLENLNLRNINRESLWRKTIEADELVIGKGSFKIYRDISLPHDSVSRVGAFPQQQLMKVPIPINIRKVVFHHTFIQYKEKNAKSDSSGKVQFYDAEATMSNVTNMSSLIAQNNRCILDFHARFLNKSPLYAKLTMYLKTPQGKFDIEGGMEKMHGEDLNLLIKPMALAQIEKGEIHKVNFNFHGTNYEANGKLVILYNNVQLSLLKKNEEKNKYSKKVLTSLIANVILKNSNPSSSSAAARVADVHYKRDTVRSFFNLLWKSIFTGVKESGGIK